MVESVSSEGLMYPPSSLEIRDRSISASYANSSCVICAAERKRFRLVPSARVSSFGSETLEDEITRARGIPQASCNVLYKETSYTTQSQKHLSVSE